MTANNLLADILEAPLGPDWTVEALAEQILGTITTRRSQAAEEFVLEADATTQRQSRRLLRPLLACLATMSAAEAGTPADLYGGRLSFERPGSTGPVWILGQFENRPGCVRLTLRRSDSPPEWAGSSRIGVIEAAPAPAVGTSLHCFSAKAGSRIGRDEPKSPSRCRDSIPAVMFWEKRRSPPARAGIR
jgi:hypothetical protein